MLFLIAILLAVFVLPSPWGLVAVVVGGRSTSPRRASSCGGRSGGRRPSASRRSSGKRRRPQRSLARGAGEVARRDLEGSLRRRLRRRDEGGRPRDRRVDARGRARLRAESAALVAARRGACSQRGAARRRPSGRRAHRMPLPRTEVAAAVVGSEIVVLGGFTLDGGRHGVWTPTRRRATAGAGFPTCRSAFITRWPSAWAAALRPRRLHGHGMPLRTVFVLERGALARAPAHAVPARPPQAPASRDRIVVAGGVTRGAGVWPGTRSPSTCERAAGRSSPARRRASISA